MILDIVILAAGQGTRMRSALPKVLHSVAGKSMLGHVIDCARALSPRSIHVVIGHGADLVRETLDGNDLNWVLQGEQLGTGHAVAQALPHIIDADQILVLYGDVPLLKSETLQRLSNQAGPNTLGLLTVTMDNPIGYGRIVRDGTGLPVCQMTTLRGNTTSPTSWRWRSLARRVSRLRSPKMKWK